MTFRASLKYWRERKEMTQGDLAYMAGVHWQTIASWEQGTRQPGFMHFINLADALDITLDDLAWGPRGGKYEKA